MTHTNDAEIHLELALFSILAAAEQCGMDPELLRLMAIGGLTKVDPPEWVKPGYVPGAVAALNEAVRTYAATSPTASIAAGTTPTQSIE